MRDLSDMYSLRLARAADISAMQAVECAADELFRPTGMFEGVYAMDAIPDHIFRMAFEDDMVRVAVQKNGEVVGFTLCSHREPDFYLDQISVHPDHGRQGLGRALLSAVLADAEARKYPSVSLSTFRDVAWNAPFYRRLGFKEIPRKAMTDWMFELEALQARTMDVSKRCFMRRKLGVFSRAPKSQLTSGQEAS